MLKEGVPTHLRAQLESILRSWMYGNRTEALLLATSLEITVKPDSSGWVDSIVRELRDDDVMLDFVDLYLKASTREFDVEQPGPETVSNLFNLGHSVWQVMTPRWSPWYLERRVSDEALNSYKNALGLGDGAAQHLSDAWQAVFSRQSNPSIAWSSATKALEAALAPIVIPKNERPQYGPIVKALKDKPSKWDADLSGGTPEERVQEFVRLLELVPYAPDRHGKRDFTDIDPGAARSLVLITTAILEIIRNDGLRTA